MTEKKPRFLSLHVKLGIIMLAGLIAGVGMYLLANTVGNSLIQHYYMSDNAVHWRNMRIIQDFQGYIDENHLSSHDTDEIALWTIAQEDVYILLYQNQHLAFEAGWWGIDRDDEPIGDERLDESNTRSLYPVSFRDGVFQAVVFDFSESGLYDLCKIVSMALAFVLFAVLILLYNRRVTKAIVSVSHEIQEIGRGNLQFQMTPKGNDELARLVVCVDAMRASLIEKTREEQEALEKNSELITAMSHDIRNPLTSLMGYLDLARAGAYRSEEELHQYISAGYEKALQIRTLTDELFRYALVFGGKELPLNFGDYDAQPLLDQLLGEQVVLLEQNGFDVRSLRLARDCRVRVDVTYLKRVLDNLFDNLRKYADRAAPVTFAAMVEEEWLHIYVRNAVAAPTDGVESNKIGLKICSRIMEQQGGSFRTHLEGEHFTAELLLPCLPHQETLERRPL